jgi:hypothetical protein
MRSRATTATIGVLLVSIGDMPSFPTPKITTRLHPLTPLMAAGDDFELAIPKYIIFTEDFFKML